MYWARYEQGRKAEAIISRHTAEAVRFTDTWSADKLRKFFYWESQWPAQPPCTLCRYHQLLFHRYFVGWLHLPESLPLPLPEAGIHTSSHLRFLWMYKYKRGKHWVSPHPDCSSWTTLAANMGFCSYAIGRHQPNPLLPLADHHHCARAWG